LIASASYLYSSSFIFHYFCNCIEGRLQAHPLASLLLLSTVAPNPSNTHKHYTMPESVSSFRDITRDISTATFGSICCCYVGQPFDTGSSRWLCGRLGRLTLQPTSLETHSHFLPAYASCIHFLSSSFDSLTR
jgi:hypothetical protein